MVTGFGINYFGTGNVGGPGIESSTPTPEPTATPEPTPEPRPEGNLTVGETYSISLPEYPIAISVTIPAAGWWGEPGGGVLVIDDAEPPGGAGIITFVDDGYYVYGDPCQWSTTRPDTPATTVDELVAALSAQASRDASAPVDITLDGYAGMSITLHVPDDADFAECDEDTFASWGVPGEDPARYHQGPGQIDKLWILECGWPSRGHRYRVLRGNAAIRRRRARGDHRLGLLRLDRCAGGPPGPSACHRAYQRSSWTRSDSGSRP